MLNHVFSVYGGQDLLVYHEKNAPLVAGYCIHNGGKFKLLIKTVVPGYPTQLPGSGSTGPMASGPGYPDPGGKPNQDHRSNGEDLLKRKISKFCHDIFKILHELCIQPSKRNCRFIWKIAPRDVTAQSIYRA